MSTLLCGVGHAPGGLATSPGSVVFDAIPGYIPPHTSTEGSTRSCRSLPLYVGHMSDTEEPTTPLDPMSARPLYVQLADVIAGKIASGALAPDRPIPSENHLADEYGVARLTARRAAQELRERGLIVT